MTTVVNEWEETVEMVVPKTRAGGAKDYYVCVNDRRFQIPANGKTQSLPKPIAEVLKASLEAENAAEEYMESMPNKG